MEKILPLNLSIFEDFQFVGNVGHYYQKMVCIMSALRLATEVAKGKITLDEAIMSSDEREALERQGKRVRYVQPSDKVECVSEVVRDCAINVNDMLHDHEERKKWALETMPRLVATNLGDKFEMKVSAFENELKLSQWAVGYLDDLRVERDKLERGSEAWRKLEKRVVRIETNLRHFANSISPGDLGFPASVEWHKYKLERVLAFIQAEKEKRAKTAETRAKNKRLRRPDSYDLGA